MIGGKAPILEGAQMCWVIKPFMEMKEPYDELKEFAEEAWDWWDENGKMRERIGELINRVGMRVFLKEMGIKAIPQMVKEPRSNPYVLRPYDFNSSFCGRFT
jgi:sulfite reductase alpha subunit